jgi:hypothetical protein
MVNSAHMAALALAAAVALGGVITRAQAKVDVTGKWLLQVTTDAAGTTTPTVTFQQEGEGLTGHYSSETLGEAEVTGTIKGQAIVWSFNVDMQGQSLGVKYEGTVESATTMKGTIDLSGLGSGTFSGKKQ